jgi:hypothetical protein
VERSSWLRYAAICQPGPARRSRNVGVQQKLLGVAVLKCRKVVIGLLRASAGARAGRSVRALLGYASPAQ